MEALHGPALAPPGRLVDAGALPPLGRATTAAAQRNVLQMRVPCLSLEAAINSHRSNGRPSVIGSLPQRPATLYGVGEGPAAAQGLPAGDAAIGGREEANMKRALNCAFAVALGLAVAAVATAPQSAGQSGPGWTVLLDDKTMGEWDKAGESNWRLEDGAVVADKRTSKDFAYLVSKQKYKDFQVYAEFWASDDANSGIYLRCQDPAKITDKNCYEANIFDQRKDPSYGTGAITRFVEVSPMPKAGGKWNTFEVTAKGRQIVVVLNGQKTAELNQNEMFIEGPIALQHAAGVIKFRKVAIKPL
jgi:hypothetical protein